MQGSGQGLVGHWLVWAVASWTKGIGDLGGVWGDLMVGRTWGAAKDRDVSIRDAPGDPARPAIYSI